MTPIQHRDYVHMLVLNGANCVKPSVMYSDMIQAIVGKRSLVTSMDERELAAVRRVASKAFMKQLRCGDDAEAHYRACDSLARVCTGPTSDYEDMIDAAPRSTSCGISA